MPPAALATVPCVVHSTDVVAIGDLAGEALAVGTGVVQEVHDAIAARPFGVLGRPAAPVRAIHNGIARAAYASVAAGLRAASRAGAAAAASRVDDRRPPLAETRGGTVALAGLNAVYGDRIARRGNRLALEMEIRRRSRVATPRVAVFIHGLGETERSWGYAERLEDELGVSSVTLRYNTGLHISQNGHLLARLLDRLVADYYFVAAAVADGPLGALAGDLLVRVASASGISRHRRVPFEAANGLELTGLHHFALLDHPLVYDQLRRWLSGDPAVVP